MNADVDRAKELFAANSAYPQGCSGYVCDVLQIAFEPANGLMGDSPSYIGANGSYSNLNPGEIVGWKSTSGSGHVAVYVGEAGMTFLDVRQPGGKPRKVLSYGAQAVYKSSR